MNRLNQGLAAAFGAAMIVTAQAAVAQEGGDIEVGGTISGQLTDDDPTDEGNAHYDVYRFDAEAGTAYSIVLRSGDFDAYLVVYGPGDLEMRDDDGEEGTNSRIVFTASADGEYVIWANSLFPATGNYELSLEGVEITATELNFDVKTSGELGSNSLRLPDDTLYETYVFEGRTGETVTIDMLSEDFDAYLVLNDPATGERLAFDDDGGEGTDARIIFTLPRGGRYEIVANSVFSAGRGDFTLLLSRGEPDRTSASPRISYGEIRRGTLTYSDREANGAFYDLYQFDGAAGDEVTIVLMSDDIDPVLFLGRLGEDDELATNDDMEEDVLDSRIEFTLPESGIYQIEVFAYDEGDTGSYILGLGARP